MSVIKKLLQQLWYFLGFPRPATEDQKNEVLITMREPRDCLVVAIATICGVTYERSYKALWHFNLPFFLESPVFANPLNAIRAFMTLGFSPKQRLISELLNGMLPIGKTLLLVHDPRNAITGTLLQHYVVFMGRNANGDFLCHWGISQELKVVPKDDLVNMLTSGWPNCILSVEGK